MALEPDDVTLGRLRRFVDERLTPALDTDRLPMRALGWSRPGEPPAVSEALALSGDDLVEVVLGQSWGEPWSTTWLSLSADIPVAWAGEEDQVDVVVDLGFTRDTPGFQAEGTARDTAGRALKGISPRNRHVPLSLLLERDPVAAGRWSAGEAPFPVRLWVEAAANPVLDPEFVFAPTELGDPATLPARHQYRWGEFVVRRRHPQAWALLRDLSVLSEQRETLPASDLRRGRILRAVARALDLVQISSPAAVRSTALEAREALAPVLSEPAAQAGHHVVAVGHAHIDSAWLWPFRETRRKVVRTYANALALLREYPETTFATSSAQHLAWVKEAEPELFERIVAAAREGRFVPVGGMWVESDTMLPGGESMVRQLVEGVSWMETELGVRCRGVWLPDSFGYSAALPQIARAAGMRWLLTQKLSWNDTNRMPHHTFWWEGIDGSQVLTHFPPVDNYNSDLAPRQLAHAEANVADSDPVSASVSLAPSGWGDGGGGPTREHAESARRLSGLAGTPAVSWGTPEDFFTDVERRAAETSEEGAPLGRWSGEMPLELHRGIFTSQHRTKEGNRRCESLLHEAELWSAVASLRCGVSYPREELRELWRVVLLHQFHDVLPGTSIAWVYHEVERAHARVIERCEELVSHALRTLAGSSDGQGTDLRVNSGPVVLNGVAPFSAGAVQEARPARAVRSRDLWVLEDSSVRVEVDARGHVVALVDRSSGRDAIGPAGPGNVASLHRDLPNRWDAWDIDAHHDRVVRDFPEARVRAQDHMVIIERDLAQARLVQRLELDRGALRVTTEVDWHAQEELLTLSWPWDLRADDIAAETQFGHVRRPMHRNTTWQSARFVDAAHRWVHVGEPGFGVAIANHVTHGYDAARTTRPDGGTTTRLRVHLLRGPRYPDPRADEGRHEFVHLLRPGATVADAIGDGLALALPLRAVSGPADPALFVPLVRIEGEGIVVDTVKLAEDGSGELVVRLHEAWGTRATGRIEVDIPGLTLMSTDLHERPLAPGDSDGSLHFLPDDAPGAERSGANMMLRPFGILTLRACKSRGEAVR
ncbi:alpha-mannosidase [Promicromonospora soli]|uniref:Glycosyl hydrolase n=1 Tax=Promicromonospora soli TaxID=2035533 RepID=A0A919G5W1_9MICO|nr:glycoside hydrolase family 38 C-terminal domain-containing protein [Promicromonospora soli]GHH78832.1 putative glycosyl hydrolase [Promicromonospora soli]